jgi:site-specific DNA recombinase
MLKAFTVIRISGEDQLKGYGPDVQWEYDIVPIAPELGLQVSEQYRRILQESATGWDRAKWEAAVREALVLFSKGDVQALMFPRVDRETRFVAGSFPLLVELIRAGLRVFFGQEKFELDLNDSESVEKYMNKAVQAQQYAETTKRNTTRGKRISASKGNLPQGTGRGLYGYDWDKQTKRRVVNEFEASVVQRVFTMLSSGLSAHAIATELNRQRIPAKSRRGIWHPLTIRRMAGNAAYTGATYWGKTRGSRKTTRQAQPQETWVLLPEVTPPIVGNELFETVQAVLSRRTELHMGRPRHQYLLTGHTVCSKCGSPVVGSYMGTIRYYHCRGSHATTNRGKICDARYVPAIPLEDAVWASVLKILERPDLVAAEFHRQAAEQKRAAGHTSLDHEITNLQRRIKGHIHAEQSLISLLRHDEVTRDYVLDEINRIKQDRATDEAKLAELRQSRRQMERLAKAEVNLTEFYARARKNLDECSFLEKRLALQMLDIRIKATRDSVEITGSVPMSITTTSSSGDLITIVQTSA